MSNSTTDQKATLWIVGMPLDEGQVPGPAQLEALARADVLIGESKKVGFGYLKHVPGFRDKEIYFLDGMSNTDKEALIQRIGALLKQGESVALFSDAGMPISFDPGKEILDLCRKKGFEIRSVPGATSWGTAIGLCGWEPPFLLFDFLPREADARLKRLHECKQNMASARAHGVFLETPYRFQTFLKDARKVFGPSAQTFLAWEISRSGESFFWGSMEALAADTLRNARLKGEFVLIVSAPRKIP